jgi:putative SOS response-associated peptidase YedK
VPLDGYYEWKKNGKQKTPYRIITTDQKIFSVAGLWENWKSPDGQLIQSFTLLTQTPSETIAHIHDRMPAILTKEHELAWLDNTIAPAEALSLICPYPDECLEAYEVSARVGKVTENDADLIQPVGGREQERGLLF